MEESSQATADRGEDDLILSDGWKRVLAENNRWFYVNETSRNCCWLPPAKSWRSRRSLPYGWELARSNDGKRYYINHMAKETVRSLPSNACYVASIPPRTRTVVISRHSDIGFGFVAGSEKPVLIRSVAEDGPSAGKLHANDQILKINGEDVRELPQAEVILRIKQYTQELRLEVISNDDVQDVKNQGQRKSSIMSRTTRERRRSNPVSVRFAETPVLVQYVGSPPSTPLRRSSLPLIPNALKIFLENGQTRSFLYNPDTTVKDLFMSLGEKIGLKKMDRFSLVLQATQSVNDTYVQFNERASQIYTRRNCSSSTWLCKLLLVFAPKDVNYLLKEDPTAFDYFYKQMCSQVVEGRFGWEMKYETAIKLAALHLQQYALEDKVGKCGKISVKAIEKEVGGLDNFVPNALVNTMQNKDLQRVLALQIKQTRNLCPPGQKYISPLQAKLQYLKICSELKMYGGRQFNAIIVDPTEDPKLFPDQKLSSTIFIGPNVGLSQVTNPRSFAMIQIADFNQVTGLVVTPHTEGKQNVKIFLNIGKSVTLIMGPIFETRDLVYLISGYCKYLVENARPLSIIDMTTTDNTEEPTDEVPSYSNKHCVVPDTWSYKETDQENDDDLKDIDFLQKPEFEGSELYSLIDGKEDSESSVKHPLCNGVIKTNVETPASNLTTDSKSLERIQEEPSASRAEENDTQKFVDNPEITSEHPTDDSNCESTGDASMKNGLEGSEKGSEENESEEEEEKEKEEEEEGKEEGKEEEEEGEEEKEEEKEKEKEEEEGKELEEKPSPKILNMNSSESNNITLEQQEAVDSSEDEASIDEFPIPASGHKEKEADKTAIPTSDRSPLLAKHFTNSVMVENAGVNASGDDIPSDGAEVIPDVSMSSSPASSVNNSDNDSSSTLESSNTCAFNTNISSVTTEVSKPEDKMLRLDDGPQNTRITMLMDATKEKPLPRLTERENKDNFLGISSNNDDSSDSRLTIDDRSDVVGDNNASQRITEADMDIPDGKERSSQENVEHYTNSEGNQQTDVSALKHHRRRRSSGFIPLLERNGNAHPIIITPECIIHDAVTPDVSERISKGNTLHGGELFNNNNRDDITSRSKACDQALKKLYTQKSKLNHVLQLNHSLRTTNEIVGTKRQFMIDRVMILEECIRQIQRLSETEEKRIIEVVLRLPSAIGLLTDSCTMLYNAQYSMRHFTLELIETIDKLIDVLITTDAWNSTNISDLTAELHKDKCETVHNSLGTLRKIINTL